MTTRPAYKHFKLLTLLLYDDVAVVRHPNNWVTLDVRRACELANMAAADLKLNLHRLGTIGLVSAVQWHSTYVVLLVKEPLREVAH